MNPNLGLPPPATFGPSRSKELAVWVESGSEQVRRTEEVRGSGSASSRPPRCQFYRCYRGANILKASLLGLVQELPEPARSGRPRSPKPTISGLAAASSMGNFKIGGLYRGPRLLPPAAACGSRWRRGSSCTGSARISPVRGNGRGSKNSAGCINNQPRRPITSPIRGHSVFLGPTAKI